MIELRAIGDAAIKTSETVLTPSQEILFASALYLIVGRGKRVSRTGLAALLWPTVSESNRAHRLRQTILQLKKAGIALTADRNNLLLEDVDCTVDIDTWAAGKARERAAQKQSLEFLPGYSPTFSEPFRDWIDTTRATVHSGLSRLLVGEIDHARQSADWSLVDTFTCACLALDPYNEAAVLAKAEATAMRGAKRDAVRILDQYIEEVGNSGHDLQLPASLLRRRITLKIADPPSILPAEPAFVGREAEMKILSEAVMRAREGSGSAWLITGEPGIGKSRLAKEVAAFAELQGVQVQRVGCRRSDVERPLSVFVDLVPTLREMPGALGCSQETLVALKRLTEFEGRANEEFMPTEDLTSLYGNMRRALFDLVDALVEEQCVVIAVDDVQWLDRASSRLLSEMIRWSPKKKLVFLFTSRPDAPRLGTSTTSELQAIELPPLSPSWSSRLLHAMLENQSSKADDATLQWILNAGDGNPFFLQELAKRWVETGHNQEIPPSLATVLNDRLSRLAPHALNVLQACSVLGENSTLERVEAVLEYKAHQLLAAIQELSLAGMLTPNGVPADEWSGPLRVRHDLLSMAAVERLSPVSLAFLHRRSGTVLEREISGERSPASTLWACAFHWGNAGDRARALAVARSCAEHLLDVGLPTDAGEAFRRALTYCTTNEQRIVINSRLVIALQMDGQWELSRTVLQKCRELRCTTSSDANPHDDFEIKLFDATWKASQTVECSTLLQEIERCVGSGASAAHRLESSLIGLKVATSLGDIGAATRIYQTIKPVLSNPEVSQLHLSEIEMVYQTLCGNVNEAMTAMRSFVGFVRDNPNPFVVARGLLNAGIACRFAGRNDDAIALFSESIDYSAARGLYNPAAATSQALVRLFLASGDDLQARREMVRGEQFVRQGGDPQTKVDRLYLLARLALREGHISEAVQLLETLRAATGPSQTILRKAATAALAIRIGLKANFPFESLRDLVEELEGLHKRNRATGWQDFEAYSLFLGLCHIGRETDALRGLREYADVYRLEKWPLSVEIAQALGNYGSRATLSATKAAQP